MKHNELNEQMNNEQKSLNGRTFNDVTLTS